jgi:DNA-binding SARP family transcriptional activator
MMMRSFFVGVLGPLEVRSGDQAVRVGGTRQQTVLALLGMEPNRVVTMEQLIDGVWGEVPPPTARSQIHIAVSMLRRALPDDAREQVRTQGPGYLLQACEDSLDMLRFAGLCGRSRALTQGGDLPAAADQLHAALGLWRGPVLAGLDSRAVREGAARLDEQRLAAVEERIRLDLELGRHRRLVGELQELVDQHPLRENFHGQLMTALSRSGRQAEALQCYWRIRNRLVEELGLEPGEELRRVERQILRGEHGGPAPAAEPAPPVDHVVLPRQLPPDVADFTGRTALIGRAVRALTTPADAVPIVALAGAYGVGKTATAVRVARRASAAFPDGQLFATLGATSAAEVRTQFLRALGVPATAIPADPHAAAQTYRSHLAGRRLLLVLDDVRDESQLAELLPGSPGSAVIATSGTRLGFVAAHNFDLGPLATDDALELLVRVVGADRVHDEPTSAADLVELCGHNPLALRIAAARLVSRRHWPLARLAARLRVDATCLDELQHANLSVRARIAAGYQRLPATAQRLLRRVTLIDLPVVTVTLCAALLDAAPDTAEEAAERLVEQRLLGAELGADGLVRYGTSRLIRVFAAERLAAEEPADQRTAALRRGLDALIGVTERAY